MIDRSANLRAIVTGRGNSAGFTNGARAFYKDKAHSRMRKAGKQQIAEQLEEMDLAVEEQQSQSYFLDFDHDFDHDFDSDFGWDADLDMLAPYKEIDAAEKHQQRLARRRQRYHERKIAKQVADYKQLLAELQKLDKKLEPEARHQLSAAGMLPRI